MTIEITPQTIFKLKREGFYPDEMFSLYFVLKALANNEVEMLDAYDDFNTSKRAVITLQTLYRKGMIDKAKEMSKTLFTITEKGREFLASIEPPQAPAKKIDASEWIEEWTRLFPEGVHRSDIVDTLPRMNAFMKKYKYIKEVIFAATKAYISAESANDYKYLKRSIYFISKQGEGSLLAAWCKTVLDNKAATGILDGGGRTQLIQTVN